MSEANRLKNQAQGHVDWTAGTWTNPPARVEHDGDALVVEPVKGSDAWRHTSYGFVHDTEHALLAPMAPDTAVEVDFVIDFTEQFDQAGVLLRVDAEHWVKAGVEFADGVPNLGAVVTAGSSDWSVAPVPEWAGRVATVRASRSGDAVTLRAGVDGGDLRLVRVLPLDPAADVSAGPFTCAPTRAGLVVRFVDWRVTPADIALHP